MDSDKDEEVARKCSENLINVAKTALLNGNVDAAEQFLSIAKSLGYNEEVNALLIEIEAEKLKCNNRERTQDKSDKNDSKGGTEQEKIKVPERKSDSENKNFNANQQDVLHSESENFLKKKDVDNTKSKVNNENNAKDNDFQPKSVSQNDSFEEDDFIIRIAQDAINRGDLKKAVKILLTAERTCPSDKNKKLLQELLECFQPKSIPQNESFEEDDLIIRIAQDAINRGDLKKAVKFLLAAQRSCPSDRSKKLLQELLDSVSNNASKDTNNKKGSVNEDIGTRGVIGKHSNVNKSATLTGNYKTPTYASKVKPGRLDKDWKDKISPSVTVTVTKQRKDKSPTSLQEPLSVISKTEQKKCVDAVTITKITSTSKSNVLSETRNVADSNDMNFKNQNDGDNTQLDQKEEPLHVMLWKVACRYYKMGKLDEAEHNLIEYQRIHNDSRADQMLKDIREQKGNMSEPKSTQPNKSENSQAQRYDTNCEAEKCYKTAEFAMTKQQFDQAEQPLLKAEQIRPQVHQRAFLTAVRQAKGTAENSRNKPRSSHEGKEQPSNNPPGSKTSETTNRNSFPSKEDVQSGHSTVTFHSNASGNDIHNPEFGKNSEDSTVVLNRSPGLDGEFSQKHHAATHRADVHANENEVENNLKKVQDAFTAQDYGTPEKLVLEAQNLRPSDAATFSEQIRATKTENEVEAKLDSTSRQTENYTYINLNKDVKNLEIRDDRINAQQCMDMARKMMSSGDLEKAKRWLLQAQRFYPTEESRRLLKKVRALLKEAVASNKYDVNVKTEVNPNGTSQRTGNKDEDNLDTIDALNRCTAEMYTDAAAAAISSEDLEEAKRLLLKAESFYSTKQARELLDQVQQALLPKE